MGWRLWLFPHSDTPHPPQQRTEQGIRKGHGWDSWPKVSKEIFLTIALSNWNHIMENGGGVLSSEMAVAWSLLVGGRVIAFISLEFFLSLLLCSSWLRSFLAFVFPILSLFLLIGRREWAATQVLSYWPESTHQSSQWHHHFNWVTSTDLILQICCAHDTRNRPGFPLLFSYDSSSFPSAWV